MTITAQLADGRELEFPEGTDPAVIQRTVKSVLGQAAAPDRAAPSTANVAANAGNSAIAGTIDTLLNAPTNVWNLGKAAFGTAATALGHPDAAPDLTPTPDLAKRAMTSMGFIRPEWAPQTTGQRFVDAGMRGGVGMAMSPASNIGQLIATTGLGVASGLLGQGTTEATGDPNLGAAASMLVPPAAMAAKNAADERMAQAAMLRSQKQPFIDTMNEVRGAGYVMPPSTTNPTLANRIIESIAGKAATGQEVSLRNQGVTDALMRRNLGAPADMPLDQGALDNLANQRAQPYRDLAALPSIPARQVGTFYGENETPMMAGGGQSPADLLSEWRATNLRAKSYLDEIRKTGSVEAQDAYAALRTKQAAIETAMEDAANTAGHSEIVPALRQARTDIAKIHDVGRALNPDRGETSAIDLAKARDRGVPLSGELLTAAKMGSAFPKSVQRPENIGSPAVNNLAALLGGAGGGGLGAFMHGAPGAAIGSMVGAAIPQVTSTAARNLILSPAYQRIMGTPNYSPGLATRILNELPPQTPQDAAYRALMAGRIQGQQQ